MEFYPWRTYLCPTKEYTINGIVISQTVRLRCDTMSYWMHVGDDSTTVSTEWVFEKIKGNFEISSICNYLDRNQLGTMYMKIHDYSEKPLML